MDTENPIENTNNIMIKKSTFAGLLVVIISVVAMSAFFADSYITNVDSDKITQLDLTFDTSKLESQTENNPVVADVNGQEIRLDEVEKVINAGLSKGQQLDRTTALNRIITKTLLLEEAQNRGITITLTDAAEEMNTIYIQNGFSQEQFEEELEQIGTTYDQTLETFREELIMNEMLTDEFSKVEIQVSDEEAKIFFDDNMDIIKDQNGNSTVFADVSSQIKTTLLQQKQQKMVLDFIEDLENKAMILTYKDKLQ